MENTILECGCVCGCRGPLPVQQVVQILCWEIETTQTDKPVNVWFALQ